MRTTVQEVEGAALIGLFGELDISVTDEAQAALTAAEAKQPKVLVLDLRGLRFLDSSGIRLVVEADLRARRDGRRFLVVRGPEPVHRVFTIALLERRLEFLDEPPVDFPEDQQDPPPDRD